MHFISAAIPGTGGTVKESFEDFEVEELPLYEPCGEGEHLYLLVEKRGVTTLDAVRRLARALKVPEREVGYAGMKDARGVTRQYLSFPKVAADEATALELPGLRIVSARRHRNKLKLGHLRGNRFRIVVRGVAAGAAGAARDTLALLERRGVPNRFGAQRYGALSNSHLIGFALLRGDYEGAVLALLGDPEAVRDEAWRRAVEAYRAGDYGVALHDFPSHCRTEREVVRRLAVAPDGFERAFAAVDLRLKRLYVNAAQSSLFDAVLEKRLESYDTLIDGDVAWKHDNGACFSVADPAAEADRAARFEISPTGPLFGRKMKEAAGAAAAIEDAVLAASGITHDHFARLPAPLRPDGERRPLRVPLGEPAVEERGDDLLVSFSLPRGAYATAVLSELMKNSD